MYEEYDDEKKWQAFLKASALMQAQDSWLEEYAVFGDGLDSPFEYQKNLEQ